MFKKLTVLVLIGVLFSACNSTVPVSEDYTESGNVEAAPRSAPFSKGVNFSAWFESHSAESIPFTRYTEQDFIDAKSLGADVIRLPVRMHSMTGGAPGYILEPLFLRFLDTAVDWAEKHQLYIIIDNHSFDPIQATSDNIDQILIPVWEQIARRYRNRSSLVIYEILNEPHGISDARWGEIQGKTIEAIRRIDRNRLIIVGGTDYNSIGKLNAIPNYNDSNLIYTFHFYDPYLFTHQGETWGGAPTLSTLENLPFPYNFRRMPRIPNNLRGTWVEGSLNYSYPKDANPAALRATLDKVVAFSKERNVPVFCGEFGVYMIQSPKEDRIIWYEIVAAALDRRNISRTSWDYYGGFGLFNGERGSFNHDLNTGVARALGFTPPPQIPRTEQPLNSGFYIYNDFPNAQFVNTGHWGQNVVFSLYDTSRPSGEYSIRWSNASQYDVFYFEFDLSKRDFRTLVNNNYYLEFKARAASPVDFAVRFVNIESSSSIPWRMQYNIDSATLTPDGNWHTIRIPLNQMSDIGAWLNATQQWVVSRGEFTWQHVFRLEFVAEQRALPETIWFDDIRLGN